MVFYLVPLWLLAVSVHLLGSTLISGGEWSVKNSRYRKILVESHGSRSLVVLAAMYVSQSVFFYTKLSRSLDHDFSQGSKSWFIRLPVFVNYFFSSLDIE